MSKGKLLLVVNNIDTFWTHRAPLARAIMADGWELHLATSHAAKDKRVTDLGMIPHDLPAYTSSLNPLWQAKAFYKIFQTLRAVKPDLVHAITIRYSFFTGMALRASNLKTPCVFTVAGLGSLFTSDDPKVKAVRGMIVPFFKFAFGGDKRFLIFQNKDDAKQLVRVGAVDKSRCGIIRGSGVDPDEYAYTPEPAGNAPVVLFASRLLKAKGILEFVHAARIIKSKGIAARFVVAGDIARGNHDSLTKVEMDDLAGEGTLEWLGQRDDVADLMRGAALVVLPSYYGEGVPKVLLEAASTGRAIITTDMPGCKETVEDGVTGLLVEPKNAWVLAEAIEELLKDPARREAMGKKGRERILADFTVQSVNAKTLKVYGRF